LLTPLIHARALRRQIDSAHSIIPRRLEMIRNNQYEMRVTVAGDSPQRLASKRAGAP
jgi:hypothetical protein